MAWASFAKLAAHLLWLQSNLSIAFAPDHPDFNPTACTSDKEGNLASRIMLQKTTREGTPEIWSASSASVDSGPGHELIIPKVIHSCAKGDSFLMSSTWRDKNPGWRINQLTQQRQIDLIKEEVPDVLKLYRSNLVSGVELADIARVIAVLQDGGVYFDSDVMELVPIEQWLPSFNFLRDVHMILGTEFPHPTLGNPVQFSNYAFASVPNSPILKRALNSILSNVHTMPGGVEHVLARTGPVAFTKAVLQAIQEGGAALPSLAELNAGSGHLLRLRENDGSEFRLVLLPYRAFGFNEHHGNDVFKGPWQDHLIEHLHMGSWK